MSIETKTAPFTWREITREEGITCAALMLRCAANGEATAEHLPNGLDDPHLINVAEAILRMRTVLEAVAQMESCEVGDCPVCAAKALLAELHEPEVEDA